MAISALSASTRASLSALEDITAQMAAARTRLSTGLKVASPLDGPAAYFAAARLRDRAAALGAVSDGMSTASGAFAAARNGLVAVEKLLTSAQGIASLAQQTAPSLATVKGTRSLAASSPITGGGRLSSGNTITVGDGATTVTYTVANNDTVQTFLNVVNGAANLNVSASLNSSGELELVGRGTNVVVGGTAPNLTATLGITAGTTSVVQSAARLGLAQQFDQVLKQIDQAVADSGYEGVNLLAGRSLSVTLNESGSSKLDVSGAATNAASLGLTAVVGAGAFQVDSEIATALTQIKDALGAMQVRSSALASQDSILNIRKQFSAALANSLSEGADRLTLADADADSALLLALQTRQQIATTTLAIAGQEGSLALRLFGR